MHTFIQRAMRASILLAATAAAACGGDSSAEHVQRGDTYVQQGQLSEAAIEYRNALQSDGSNGELRLKLADTFLRLNDGQGAAREFIRAADLLPDNADAQLKAGRMLLLARQFEDARARADKALALDAKSVDAQLLRANALAGLKDLDGAIAEYEEAIAQDPTRSDAYQSLGALQFVSGNTAEAEAAFLKAVEQSPKNVGPHLALANYYWASGRQADAEKALRDALAVEPSNAEANRALGVFMLASGRPADAEPFFKTIADNANTTAARLTLAQYYTVVRRWDDARRVLAEVAKKDDGFAVATVRLAALDAAEGSLAQAQARVATVLDKQPKDAPALLMKAILLRADRKRSEALKIATEVAAANPSMPNAHFLAGQLYAELDRPEEAQEQYEQVLKLDRRPAQAAIELARLHLRQRALDKALTYAQQAIGLQPQSVVAHDLLARIYLAQGALDKAKVEVDQIQKAFPNEAIGYNLGALAQIAAKQPQAARASYEKALSIAPANLEALTGVVTLDAAAGRVKDAVARVDGMMARQEPSSDLLMLAARAKAAAGDSQAAEELLQRAITIDPDRLQAYGLLGQLYVQQKRLGEALDRFKEIATRNPKSIAAPTMIGMLLEAQGKGAEAEQAYRQVLSIDRRAAVASNNLAYLYVSSGRNLDEALQLAQTAKEQLPEEPHVSDTIGWIYVKKNMITSAIPHLEASATKTPDDPVAQYHLGMAYMQSGDFAKAKESLARALRLASDFDGAAEARKTLAAIGA